MRGFTIPTLLTINCCYLLIANIQIISCLAVSISGIERFWSWMISYAKHSVKFANLQEVCIDKTKNFTYYEYKYYDIHIIYIIMNSTVNIRLSFINCYILLYIIL